MKRLFLIALLVLPLGVMACDCPQGKAPTVKELEAYELIFEGKVDSVTHCKDGTALAWFHVADVFKGNAFTSFPVVFDCSSDCQMSFVAGETWMIFATAGKQYQTAATEFCSRSRKQPKAGEQDLYSVSSGGLTYDQEKNFLAQNFSAHAPKERKAEQLMPKNIIPRGYTPLWWLLGSFVALILLYFGMNRLWKKMS